jgi:hypothetical protein
MLKGLKGIWNFTAIKKKKKKNWRPKIWQMANACNDMILSLDIIRMHVVFFDFLEFNEQLLLNWIMDRKRKSTDDVSSIIFKKMS